MVSDVIAPQQQQTLWAEQNSKHLGTNAVGQTQWENTVGQTLWAKHKPATQEFIQKKWPPAGSPTTKSCSKGRKATGVGLAIAFTIKSILVTDTI